MTPDNGARILVVEDDPGIQRALKTNLMRHGFDVETAETGELALERFSRYHPDLILLDLGLPDIDGTDVIRYVRERSTTPIVVLSVRGAERDKVEALDLGADDYLTKPFGVAELLARVRVALRHVAGAAAGTAPVFRAGDLEVDVERRHVRVGDDEVRLTPTEYELLKTFVSQPDKVLTDRMLLRAVWGPEYGSEAHYLHVYVARLRRKIEKDPQKPRHLLSEPGVGYRLVSEPPS
jgi:two-component system KDP operon response regulator KdpE